MKAARVIPPGLQGEPSRALSGQEGELEMEVSGQQRELMTGPLGQWEGHQKWHTGKGLETRAT